MKESIKLIFIINDFHAVRLSAMITGSMISMNRRSVVIDLCESQIMKLGLKKIGVENGRDLFETIESISLSE
jgi:hypothetical protein